LYFLSDRNVAAQWDSFDFQLNFDKTSRIELITLAAGTPPPQPVESDEEPGSLPEGQTASKAHDDKSEEAENDKSKPAEGEKKKEPYQPEKLPEVKVDLDGITDRLMELPIAGGRYSGLGAAKGKLFYLSREETTGPPKLKLYDFSGKKPKETEIASG